MPVEKVIEKWTNKIGVVKIGASASEGGTRSQGVKIGGEFALPFLKEEGELPNRQVVAVEVWDVPPEEVAPVLADGIGSCISNPVEWAKKAEKEWGADLIYVKLLGIHPDSKNKSAEETVEMIKAIKSAVKLPIMVWGCGDPEKDNVVIPKVSEALKGEKALLGSATQTNYKILAACALADGHSVIAESPLDINICKQVNILLSDMELPSDRIVIFPTNGAIGYGFEYAYSIIERTRIAGLGGDKMMAMPIIVIAGWETWRAKEAKAPESENPKWGDEKIRGPMWEATTAVGYLQAGANLVTMLHPEAVTVVKKYIDEMTK